MADAAFAIRVYGKRWVQMTRRPDQDDENNGWRAVTWTDDVTDAEKWSTRAAAQSFADTLPGRVEVTEIQPAAAPTPTGGKIRAFEPANTQAMAA